MKTQIRLIIASAIALGMGSCTTGSLITGAYQDDIYFNPGSVPPPVTARETPPAPPVVPDKNSEDKMVISQLKENEDGTKTLNNYILKNNNDNPEVQAYNLDQQTPDETDTTVYYNDDQVKYVINNYYEGDDMDYAFRIRRFHDPYFYDSFYDNWMYGDNWYSPYFSFGWGWDPYFSLSPSAYYGWGYNPCYYGWYSPYYAYQNPWYYDGYYGYWGGYYPGYWGGGGAYYSDNYSYGRRRNSGSNVYNMASGRRMGSSFNREVVAKSNNPSDPTNVRDVDHSALRANSISGATRGSNSNSISNSRASNTSNQVLVERRRDGTSYDDRRSGTSVQRTVNSTQPVANSNARRNYDNNQQSNTTYQRTTPSQNLQETRPSNDTKSANTQSNRANYNRQVYTRPSTSVNYSTPRVVSNGASGNTRYSTPQSNANYNRTYRSSSTYNSSSSVNSNRSYSAPSSSSGSSYRSSTPSSSGSYNPGSSSSGSSSGSVHSSGGSSSSGSSSVSHSGRR
jgi:hypothetical protein